MIRCVWRKSPFDPSQRAVWDAPWTEAATVAGLMPEVLRGLGGDVRVLRNGYPVDPADYGRLLGPSDHVEFGLDASGDPFSAWVAANALFTIEATAGTVAALTAAAPFVNLAVAVAVTSLVSGLLKQKPPKPGEIDSATYGFGGVGANPAYAGAPYPMVFGEMRVSGPIINLFTSVLTEEDEYLYVLIMVAGHEVASIGGETEDGGPFALADSTMLEGLEIDGESAENFTDVECWVRLGTPDQSPIPGFAQPVLQYGIGREVRVGETPGGLEQTPGVYQVGDAEIDAWDTPVGHTTEIEADNFDLLLRFDRGLFRMNTDQTEAKARTVEFQVRYRRATNGQPLGDYVILPSFGVTANKQLPFTYSFARDFIDPTTYVLPSDGYYLDLTGGAADCAFKAAVALSSQATAATQMTCVAWVKLTNTSTFDSTNWIAYYIGSNEGFRFRIKSAVSGTHALLSAGFGDGAAITDHDDAYDLYLRDSLQSGNWTMVAFTYEASANADGTARLRFYCNEKLIGSRNVSIAQSAEWPTSGTFIAGASASAGTQSLDGSIDELIVYDRVLSPIEIISKYNGGEPAPALSSETGIVAGWHFDATNTGGTTTPDLVGSEDLTLVNTAAITSGTSPGPVPAAATGTTLRDRYQIEIQRLTALDTSDFAADTATLSTVQLTVYEEFSYPGQALLALKMRASGQTGGQPQVTIPVRGYNQCPVWDGQDASNPTFDYAWTRNPAWIFAAAALDVKLGAGTVWKVHDIDWETLYDAAAYWDEKIQSNDTKDANGDPAQIYVDVSQAEVQQASTASGTDANFVTGMIQIQTDVSAWPSNYPSVFAASVAEADAEWWFAFTGVSFSGAPAWLSALEGIPLAVGYVTFDPMGGVGGGGGGGTGTFEIWVHTPTDPATDATYTPGTGEVPVIERYERRMEFDGVFDRADLPRWEALRIIAKSARATPLPTGGGLSLWYDAPRDIDNMIGMGNTVARSFTTSFSGVSDRPNVIEGTFLDRARGYEQVPVQARHPNVINPSTLASVRLSQESFEGITRATQLERHLRYKLNFYHLARRLYQATGGPDLLGVSVGNRLAVSHDITGWGYSGRIQSDSANKTTVRLDRPVELVTGTSYQIRVRDVASQTVELRNISSSTGSYAAGDSLSVSVAFSFTPLGGGVYQFGETDKLDMSYLVLETGLDAETMTRSLLAVQYDAQVYDDAYGTLPAAVISYLSPPTV